MAALGHENIVHIYDFISRGESMFIVMEYVEGIDLYDLMNQVDRIPPDIAAIIALQAARALEYAHYRGVVHRDFKPSNLMITKQGEVKLMDFGIARDEAFDDLTWPGTALGTPAYMSPEQILGERVDFRSDLFSFGIVLYQMLTGQKPFADDDTKSVLHRILNEPYERPRKRYPDVPMKLQGIVRKCLEKRPDRRYRSTEALRRDLEDFVASKVRINFDGRLVIFLIFVLSTTFVAWLLTPFLGRLRRRFGSEAKPFVHDEELKSSLTFATDTGAIDARAVVLRPIFALNLLLALILVGWTSIVEWRQLGTRHGYIHVNATPWAEVWVDGGLYDTTPFATPIALKPGRHTLELKNRFAGNKTDDFRLKTEVVEVKAGDTTRLQVEFKK